jgi:energy-coupling factor transporter ATP-binding protein EcfA2
MGEWGKTVLHASAVVTPVGAIVFIGESGQGKSTLCAAFGQLGFPALTDDCLLLEHYEDSLVGISSYPGLRLWPDTVSELFSDELSLRQMAHYSDKKRLGSNDSSIHFYSGRVPIAGIYCLASIAKGPAADPITIQPLGPAVSLIELASHRFCLRIPDMHKLSEDYHRLSLVVNSLGSIHCLYYPRDLALLPRVVATVLEHSQHGREAAIESVIQ